MPGTALLAALLAAAVALTACRPETGELDTDFDRHVAALRASGMSESARSDLLVVADIRAGRTLLEFPRDDVSGRLGRSYMSATCPNPKASDAEVRAFLQELERAAAAELDVLRGLADADDSGFVTSAEGRRFRAQFEFGLLARAAGEAASTPTGRATAAGLSRGEWEKRRDEYESFRRSLRDRGADVLPALREAGVDG